LVKHGSTGYLAQPGNIDDLAQGLAWCLEHRSRLSDNAREAARAWTWEAACEQVAKVYEQAMVEEPPTVSVIIPRFNYAEKVGRAIQSVLAQDYAQQRRSSWWMTDPQITGQLSGWSGFRTRASATSARTTRAWRTLEIQVSPRCQQYICCLDADDAIDHLPFRLLSSLRG
jgi:hypothetical protein